MKIKKLHLKNGYKRFQDLTIDLGDQPKRIVALVGPNGSGKSSVIDGMLYYTSTQGTIGNKGHRGFEYHSMQQHVTFNQNNVEIELSDGKFDALRDKRRQTDTHSTLFSFRSPYRYNSSLKIAQMTSIPAIKGNGSGASYTIDIDDKMESNYQLLLAHYNKVRDETDSRPSEAKQKVIGDLNQALKNCLDLEISSLGDIISNQGTLFFQKKDHPQPFEFNVLSAGEKEVVDILIDLYLRKQDYNDTVFLFDEPELHINSAIQRKLLLEINKMVGANCQIWIATHSIGFLRALQTDLRDQCQIIYFKPGVPWASSVQVLQPIKPTIATWREIFATALDDLSGLVSPKQLIYCEGKDKPGAGGKEKGMDAIVFNTIFNEKYPDTQFISSGGNTELDQRSDIALAILTKVFSDIEILVLKDRDMASGKLVTAVDRQTYLDHNPKSHRVLSRWEIENYLFDKEVLKVYCLDKGFVFDEIAYDAFVTDIDNQNIKDDFNRIKNFCNITTSVAAEKFKENLAHYVKDDMKVYKELEDCIF